jgi:hypothetical protein
VSFRRETKRGREELAQTPPAATASETDHVVPEPELTVREIGRPSYETAAAAARAWQQELVRSGIALLFTLIFVGTVSYACWAATTHHWPAAKELIQILLPAETALIGSATGFYFGTRSRDGS